MFSVIMASVWWGAVPVDVIDGFLHAGDNFHGKDEIEVFVTEVIVFDDI